MSHAVSRYFSAHPTRDKSKANHLAKALVCIQAAYFGFHFITRLGLRLGVTLLELNTFAHAVFALIIYVIWWDKPLDIDEPVVIPIRDAEVASICAAMYLGSDIGKEAPLGFSDDLFNSHWYPKLARYLARGMKGGIINLPLQPEVDPSNWYRIRTRLDDQPDIIPEDIGPEVLHIHDRPKAFGFECAVGEGPRYHLLTMSRQNPEHSIYLSREMLLLRRLASSTEHGRKILAQSSSGDREYAGNDVAEVDWVLSRKANWPPASSGSGGYVRTSLGFILVSTVYGGWHLLAWNGPFNGRTTMILWRLSGLGVAASGLVGIGAPLALIIWADEIIDFFFHSPPMPRAWKTWVSGKKGSFENLYYLFVLTPLASITILFLVFSRCYLVIGALLLLPYSADSVYQTPDWTLYFPHLG